MRKFQEKYAHVNGIRIRYLDWEGAAPPIVLLHNNRGAADPWQRFVNITSLPSRFIAPDERGCGASDKPDAGYSVWHLAADVAQLIDTLQLGRVPVIGCALGGSIGLALAANYPDKVSAVIMLDSGFPIAQEVIDRSVAVLTAMPHEFPSKRAAQEFVRTTPPSLGYAWSPVWEEYFEWTFEELADGRWAFKFDKPAMIEATSHLSDDLWEDSRRVQCPVLVSVSAKDGIVADEGARKLAQMIPYATFKVLDGMHHLVFLEQDLGPIDRLVCDYLKPVGV